MKPFLSLSFVATFLWVASHASADDFDLYYLGGQSNMEGFGTNSELAPSDQGIVPGAWIYQSTPLPDQQPVSGQGIWAPLQPGHGTGFVFDGKANRLSNRFGVEIQFAKSIRERHPNRKIAILKVARNGSSIHRDAAGNWGCWEPDFMASSGENRDVNQYDQFLASLRNASSIEDIDGDGTRDRLIPCGILWMQGESDAVFSETIAKDYTQNLKRLMDLMRAAFRNPDLPVVIGRISDSKRGTQTLTWKYGELVREGQQKYVEADRFARLVTETDTYRYSDPWHYDSAGYIDLGKQFAEKLLSIPTQPLGAMLEKNAVLKTEVGGGVAGEGPAFSPMLGVLTSGNGNIHRWSRDGVTSVFREKAGTNGLLFDRQGRLLACEPEKRRVSRMELDGSWQVLTDHYEGKLYNTPNDITFDSKDRIYFSDPRYGNRDTIEMRDANGDSIEGVYRIDTDGTVHRVLGREVERANGVLVTRGDEYLVVADNNNDTAGGARKLWRFQLKSDGTVDVHSKRLLFDWGKGRGPDGVKQDTEGNLYVAGGLNRSNPPFEPDSTVRGGVYVLNLEGKLLDFIAVPTDEVTNCAFGGDDRKTLYITGGGVLYSIRTKYAGWTGSTK